MKKSESKVVSKKFNFEPKIIEARLFLQESPLLDEEVNDLYLLAVLGYPLGALYYGVYQLLYLNDEETAKRWWKEFLKHANGEELYTASKVFGFLRYDSLWKKCLIKSSEKGCFQAIGFLEKYNLSGINKQ